MAFNHRQSASFYLIFILIAVLTFLACSTQKDRWINKQYHTIVAKYNAYFNGRESLRAGIATIKNAHEDNFDELLDIYITGTEQQGQSVSPQMDRAIEKAVKVIRNHSMTFRGVEYNKWVKESYMMIGDANFYKHEYEMASQTYDFVIRLYHYSPIIYEAYLKSVITNNITGNFGKSWSMLEQLEQAMYNENLSRRQTQRYYKALSDYYIKNNMYDEAALSLYSAIDKTRRKKDKIRLNYILGQIQMRNGNLVEASRAFNRVVRLRPPYEFEFNAKISAAMCYDPETGDRSELVDLLNNMLRKDINRDFLDQIYYALAQISIADEDYVQAIDYLKLSTEKSVSNDRQKALSFYTIAKIYYNEPDYYLSGIYYDSTMRYMPREHQDYREISEKHSVLSELVKNLQIIEREDSLQNLASMSERDRLAVIDAIISEITAEERRRQEEERQRQQSMYLHAQSGHRSQQMGDPGGSWYFYNPQAVSHGFTEFRRRWGDRRLEDNWRLSQKEMVLDFADEFGAEGESDTLSDGTVLSRDPTDRTTYLQFIPTTPEMLEASHNRIIDALYTCGTIYKDELSEYKLSNESFEELLKRYPDNKYALNTYYHLYLTNKIIGNTAQADYYKNIILSKHPDSEHAALIKDPESVQRRALEQDEAEVFYNDVYREFRQENFRTAYQKATEGLKRFPETSTEPKFAYVKAVSSGKIYSQDSLETNLRNFIAVYPNSDIVPLARNILNYLEGKFDKAEEIAEAAPQKQTYIKKDSTIHFYAIVVDARNINVNQLRIKFADYNKEYHRLRNLTLSNVFLNKTHQIITVANFPNSGEAMRYYRAVNNHAPLLGSYNKADYDHFVITVDNYPVFYKNKDVQEYLDFFNKHYK